MRNRILRISTAAFFLVSLLLPYRTAAAEEISVSAEAAVVAELESGRILFSKNGEKRMKAASTVKILTGLVTNMYYSVDADTRREVCTYCHDIVKEYFPDIRKNPYIRIGRLKNLPLSHRLAVRLFVFFYRIDKLYPFSVLAGKLVAI